MGSLLFPLQKRARQLCNRFAQFAHGQLGIGPVLSRFDHPLRQLQLANVRSRPLQFGHIFSIS